MIVTLTPSEVLQATAVGQGRQNNNLAKDFKDKYGGEYGDGTQKHIDGALAEAAFAKATGLRQIGVLPGPDSGDDVGEYGVRSTRHRNGCLLLHKADSNDRRFVLVVQLTSETHRIAGTILGAEGKLPIYWRRDVRHPAYFVPQDALLPWHAPATGCPVCHGRYYESYIGSTKLYICDNGCTGRRIASELGERLC